ncbi:MAG: hypothetical protein K2Q18_12270, partial [Bdellovibrionales bacterium]|nr:hypothetical protein [Bdellovibrionales bacterium]
MKLNKKLVAVNVMATLLFADVAMAKIEGVRTPGESHSSSASSSGGKVLPVKVSVAKEEDGKKITSVAEATCSSDQDTAKHFPLEMFKELTRDGNELKVEVKPENKKIIVTIPPIVNVCGRFVPEARQNDVTKNVTVLMSLIGKKDGKDVSLTYKEFEDCLKEKEILVDGKIDHDKVPGKYYTESKFSMDYEFDKKKDVQKSVSVTFAYPKEFNDPKTGYGAVYGFEDHIAVPGEACMRTEKVAKNTLFINKGKDDYLKELSDICKNGSTQEIANAKNALGNYEALEGIVDQIRA